MVFKILTLMLIFFFSFSLSQAQETTNPTKPPEPGSNEEDDSEKEKDFEAFELGEIVVTADSPVVKEIAIINEITADQIEATNSRTVAEALTYVPGIRVSTGRKNEPNISIHGFDQSKTLVLIDGVPYYETYYGKLDLDQIPSEIISKIEVAKGAQSVLYGPNAQVGVINIVTKKPSEKPSGTMNFEHGEVRYYRGSLSHGMKARAFNYWVNYTRSKSDAWKMSHGFDPVVGSLVKRPGPTTDAIFEDGGDRENSDNDSHSFWGKFGFEFDNDSEYYLNFHYINREKGMPLSIIENRVFLFRPAFSNLARFDRYDDWGMDLSGKQRITDRLQLKGKLFYHKHLDDYVSYSDPDFTDRIAISRFKDYFLGGSLFADLELADWDIARFAFHYKKDSHKDREDSYLPFQESISHTGSAALENEFKVTEDFSVLAGISYDWFKVLDAEAYELDDDGNFLSMEDLETEGTEDKLNPMVGFTYKFPDATRLFGSVAKKTRFPALNQLFSGRSGNPELSAEESINYTLGASRPLLDISVIELAFFYHDIEDWISRDGPYPDSVYRNYAKAEIYGIELDTETRPLDNVTLRLGYTYMHGKDKSAGRTTKDLRNVPEHKIDLGLRYTVPRMKTQIDLTGVYMDRVFSQLPTPQDPDYEKEKTDRFFLLNTRVCQPFTEHFEAYIAVNNLLDIDYEPEVGFPGPGRNIWLGLTARF